MYYKKYGSALPIIKAGCVYEESYFHDGYLFLKYAVGNAPSEELTEIMQEEYETNKPVIPEPEPTPTSQDAINAEILKMLNDLQLKLGGASNA